MCARRDIPTPKYRPSAPPRRSRIRFSRGRAVLYSAIVARGGGGGGRYRRLQCSLADITHTHTQR